MEACGGITMMLRGITRLICGAVLAASLLASPVMSPGGWAQEPQKTVKIGVVYDLTGPFAGGGSELQYLGAKIMIDWFNAQAAAAGYKVEPIYADAQSKPDV